MANQVDRVLMCPICLETMTKPILQCKIGHSMCGDCVSANKLATCPQCRGPLSSTRNYQLEQVIENLPKSFRAPCFFADRGCKYLLTPEEKSDHEAECKNRKFLCEGRKWANWKCEWYGVYAELEKHFKVAHRNEMEYKTEKEVFVDFSRNFRDVQIISFFNGAQYFWYKFMVDVTRQKVFWIFQYIGTKKAARNYYYEFEISKGPTRKFKVTEICDNDVANTENLFKEERCVAVSFAAAKTYLNHEGKLPIKFRIMTIKKPNAASK